MPVTIHIPLAAVPAALTTDLIVDDRQDRGARPRAPASASRRPRLAVAGLNPHAGEERHARRARMRRSCGRRSRRCAQPASTRSARSPPTRCSTRRRATTYDAALCMYHDQALIPIKTLAFDEGVNVTLGLPFVRTSPDHGTALRSPAPARRARRASSPRCAWRTTLARREQPLERHRGARGAAAAPRRHRRATAFRQERRSARISFSTST